jgi:acid phosphatase (class A)
MKPADLFGPKRKILTAAELAVLTPIMNELIETVNAETRPLKNHYARLRPYERDASIIPCVQKPKGGTSYPSSHAAVGALLADVLADLLPAKAELIEAGGIQIGENRVIGGVHHPSDVVAGRSVAKQIAEALAENEFFQADFKAARRELRAR